MKIKAKLKKQIITATMEAYPHEMCGVVQHGEFVRLPNISKDTINHFEIDHQALAEIEDHGQIEAYVHSHPDGTAVASPLDRHQIELHGKPWIICAYPDTDIQIFQPTGYKAPLIGRHYFHGWQDCYALVRDFYLRELGITLDDFERDDKWWESKEHASLYLENYEKAGFYEVFEPQYGDMILCKVGRTEHPNHAVLWLGDQTSLKSENTQPCIGSTLILHHPYNRESERTVYGPNWIERTVKILRHKDVQNNSISRGA
ncbi:C40 family peptidase [Acinetobacter bereziniae]|uniref:C40 family peptidase n=1 Tax=Acinetobacter bereziniae TaxID=106648 RepID=UPI001900C8F6|nr:C40 family peptidase [Acinetobacter bereziniae]MBJ8450344.1 C40 family peptidase [Acinetobacter bereziniae]MBJ8454621.1 C40 family peptidase [Acinetobacter bereziniae]